MNPTDNNSAPLLLDPALAPIQARAIPLAMGALVATAAFIWFASTGIDPKPTSSHLVPTSFSDLADGPVTIVDGGDRAAVEAALKLLRVPDAQRIQIEQEVLSRDRRIGWIVLTDSMDPDGDVVAVESGGITQHVVLSKAWVPVAVPLTGAPIGITAVRDGDGGGVTVALGTHTGPITLRIMVPGEHIEVAAP